MPPSRHHRAMLCGYCGEAVDHDCPDQRDGLSYRRARAADVGGCTFCSSSFEGTRYKPDAEVTEISRAASGGLTARLCDYCLDTLGGAVDVARVRLNRTGRRIQK